MELKPGYKKTEVGVIPEEWDVSRLEDISTCFSGGTPNTDKPSYYGGPIPWITSSDLNAGRIEHVNGRITAEGLANSAAKLVESGTLLVALYGATAGVCAITKIRATINQAVLAIVLQGVDTEYLSSYLSLNKHRLVSTYTQGGPAEP